MTDSELLTAFQDALADHAAKRTARVTCDAAVADALSAQASALTAEADAKTAATQAGEALVAQVRAEEPSD